MNTRNVVRPDEEYCGTTYAARLLRLSVASVQGLVESGQLEAWKTRGGHRRISMDSLQRYMREHGLERAEPQPASQRLKVLLVEDDEKMSELYRASIERWDLPIDPVMMRSAIEALMDIAAIEPDVLIADLSMPGIDGFDMIRMLSASGRHAHMAIIAVTGLSQQEIEAKGGLPPSVICRFKPLNMAWLQGFLGGFIHGRQLRGAGVAAPAAHAPGDAIAP